MQGDGVTAAEDESAIADGSECDACQFVLAGIHQAAVRSCGNCFSHRARTGRAGRIWCQIAASNRPLPSVLNRKFTGGIWL
ncbi:hypothetical protein NS506_03041 [Nocardia seriolae]|uniref:Uncharacterized protein n=1 Tax=Nocardia seriolae TaxID=37332 RepID=A0ABC8ASD0_9NOCA|nr:hypothetical protein NS506_03041 [Nocardia seriolae]